MFQTIDFHKIAELAPPKILLNFRKGFRLNCETDWTEGFAKNLAFHQSKIQLIGGEDNKGNECANNAVRGAACKLFVVAIARYSWCLSLSLIVTIGGSGAARTQPAHPQPAASQIASPRSTVQVMRVGVMAIRGIEPTQTQWQPTLDYLNSSIPNTARRSDGNGLGLAIPQNLLSLMGSKLTVRSQPGQGSSIFEFEVAFPVLDAAVQQTAESERKIVEFSGSQRTILVVDDQWENRSVLASLLQPLGFEMVEASEGQAGLTRATESLPDLIITDLVMPGMDGWQFLRCLRQSATLREIPAIASSASVFETDRHQSLEAGADVFLPKPVDADRLLELLQVHLQLEWVYDAKPVMASGVDRDFSARTETKLPKSDSIVPPPELQ